MKSKGNLTNLVGLVFGLTLPTLILATPRVRLSHPPPGLYNIENLWRATVTNPDGCTYDTCRFEGYVIEAAQGQVFYALTRPFPVPTGVRTFRYSDATVEHTQAAPGYEEFAARTGGLPEGAYTFILSLRPFGASDTVELEVKPANPPRLVLPRDGDTIVVKRPQFTWTMPGLATRGNLTYRLTIAQVRPGQSPEQEILVNQPWFEQKDIRTTSFTYPASAKALELGAGYVWQVIPSLNGVASTPSEPGSFRFGPPVGNPPPATTRPDATVVFQTRFASSSQSYIQCLDYVASTNQVYMGQSPGQYGENVDPAIAYDRNGNTWVVWAHHYGGNIKYQIMWSRRLAGTTAWSAPALLSAPDWGTRSLDPALAFDDDGKGLCVWVNGVTAGSATWPEYSLWNGAAWSERQQIPFEVLGDSTASLPEIAFTAAPSANGTTPHQAIMIVALGKGPTHQVGYAVWDGTNWSQLRALATEGGVVAERYPSGYASNPTPRHLGLTALATPEVQAVWERETPGPDSRLMVYRATWNGTVWDWQPVDGWLAGADGQNYFSPAVAAGKGTDAYFSFQLGTTALAAARCGAGTAAKLTPPSQGWNGRRPAVAWVSGAPDHVLLVTVSEYAVIRWARWNSQTQQWGSASSLNPYGGFMCRSPDIAARNGSHTMPVK